MSSFRYIDPEITYSDSVTSLTYRQRDLWTRAILKFDDQGRSLAKPTTIRSLIWPDEDIPVDEIQKDIDALVDHGMIFIYEVDGKKYIQILKWHLFQRAAEWLGLSKHPAPPGWKDRYRYHGKGNEIIKSDNWSTYSLPSQYGSPLPSDDVNGDVNGDGDNDGDGDVDNAENEPSPSLPIIPASHSDWQHEKNIVSEFIQTSGVQFLPSRAVDQAKEIDELVNDFGKDLVLEIADWCRTKRMSSMSQVLASIRSAAPGWINGRKEKMDPEMARLLEEGAKI